MSEGTCIEHEKRNCRRCAATYINAVQMDCDDCEGVMRYIGTQALTDHFRCQHCGVTVAASQSLPALLACPAAHGCRLASR